MGPPFSGLITFPLTQTNDRVVIGRQAGDPPSREGFHFRFWWQ
jgi:hypothetical protein